MMLQRHNWVRVLLLSMGSYGALCLVVLALWQWRSPGTFQGGLIGLLGGGVIAAGVCGGLLWQATRRYERLLADTRQFLLKNSEGDHSAELTPETHDDAEELSLNLERTQLAIRTRSDLLNRELERLRNVLHSMGEGVIGVDKEQRILFVNQAACRMFQLREGMAIGRPVWEQVRQNRLQAWVSDALKCGKPVEGEIPQSRLNDRDLAIRVSPYSQMDQKDQSGAVIVIVDVTELHRLERVRQEFVGNASHELKTPITAIKACVETLLDGAVDDHACRDRFLQTIDEQSDRLDSLVRDMLMLARIEGEPASRESRPVAGGPLIGRILEQHRQAAERKSIQLQASFSLSEKESGKEVVLLSDEEALEHILDNLVDNALKYTNAGGRVELVLRKERDEGVIEVRDTGIGIPQHHLPRIFERFYRVDRHRSREQGGTGLGLSIVKHLVQATGGKFQVESAVGVGTNFQIRFPLAEKTASERLEGSVFINS